jgi:hypothetical protein
MCKYPCTSPTKSILDRIFNCTCKLCNNARDMPYIRLTCIQIHFLYSLSHDLDLVNKKIKEINQTYRKNKRIFAIYTRAISFFLRLYLDIRYRPGGSGYIECRDNFYRMASLNQKI